MALEETPGAADADTYATLAEADEYHVSRLHSDVWTNADEATKEAALKMACRLLDAYPRAWTGTAATSTQSLGWPRIGMFNRNGFAIAEDEIPIELKEAQSEFARQLIATDKTADNAVINQGITSLKAGSVTLSFSDMNATNSALVARSIKEMNALIAVLPDAVKYLLVQSWLNQDSEDEASSTDFIFEVL